MLAGSAEKTSSMFSSISRPSGYFTISLARSRGHGLAAERVVGDDRRLVARRGATARRRRARRCGPCRPCSGRRPGGRPGRPGPRARPRSARRRRSSISWYCGRAARPPVELLGVGQLLDEGEVVEGDRVGLDVEAAPLELVARAQVDDRADAERRAGPPGRPRSARTGRRPGTGPASASAARRRGVAAEVAEVHRTLERDCRSASRPRQCTRCAGPVRVAVCTPGARSGASVNGR